MKEQLIGILIIVNVALIVSVFSLFSKNSQLREDFHVFSVNTESEISTIKNKVELFIETSNEIQSSISSIQGRVNIQEDHIASQNKRSEENSVALATWKDELTSVTTSKITEKIIQHGTEVAVKELANNKSIVFSQKFIDNVANTLTTNHRQKLRGESGIDANNKLIAKLLLADPDFLKRVSVSALLNDR